MPLNNEVANLVLKLFELLHVDVRTKMLVKLRVENDEG
jgi:hypothetical protein